MKAIYNQEHEYRKNKGENFGVKAKSKALENMKFSKGLKEDRETYTGKKLSSAEHKSIGRHENKSLGIYRGAK